MLVLDEERKTGILQKERVRVNNQWTQQRSVQELKTPGRRGLSV